MKTFALHLPICVLLVALLTHSSEALAQPVLKPFVNGNPISPIVYCADPTSVEYNGRLYVYGTNDQQQYDAMQGAGENSYGLIKSLVVFSTDDMQNWTYHGKIDVSQIAKRSWFYCAWAPSVVSRVEEDGLTHFYMYFSNAGSVGVLTATHPLGPWRDPLGRVFIDKNTPGIGDCNNPFDPGACFDEQGVGWLSFGGGSVNAAGTEEQPGNARIVRLGEDMLSLASDIAEIRAPYHFEANELNAIGGKLVYTYCSRWSDPSDACSMNYMVCDGDPLSSDSWRYEGAYLKNPGAFGFGYGNNHTHLHKFAGNWYLLYHNLSLLNASGNTQASGFRSLGVNTMSVGEASQKLYSCTMDEAGPSKLKNLNPYLQHSAAEMRTAVGVSCKNADEYQFRTDTLWSVLTDIQEGAWVALRNVAFGTSGASEFSIRVKGSGQVQVLKTGVSATAANLLGTLQFSDLTEFTDVSVALNPTKAKGTVALYLLFSDVTDCEVQSWQFESAETAIGRLAAEDGMKECKIFNLQGQEVTAPQRGRIYVRKGQRFIQK